MDTKKVEQLSWRGYTERKRISLAGWKEGFSMPARFLERVPYCIESYKYLKNMNMDKRHEIQKFMIDATDHSVMGSIYLGMMRPREMEWIHDQLTKCLQTVVRLIQVLAADNIYGDEISRVLKELSPDTAKYFRSALVSSLNYYSNGKMTKPFAKVMQQPFYFETGIDILTSGLQFMLAEFQVRYATPYAHLLTDMSDAYQMILPQLFEKFGLQPETFAKRRLAMMKESMERFAEQSDQPTERIVLDAWAYLDNVGANWKPLVDQLGAEYVLFDDLLKSQNPYEHKYADKRLAIFNQPAMNLIDPQDKLFERVNSERLETYDELCWSGFLDKYLDNQIFLANSPLSDILNDKALYMVIPELSRLFFGKSIELPVVETFALWDLEDYSKPNEENLKLARDRKDDYVIAHRYLEGGMGIRVGHVTSAEEWDGFIDTFVVDRPYLYVLRSRFEMDPDMSVRVLSSTSMPNYLCDPDTEAKVELTDTLYGRLTTAPPLSADNHRSFLVYKASPSSEPDYEFKEVSVR